jgi:D-alanine transaminase
MNIAYLNGQFLNKEDIKISPDDRGFLFADGIYEVVRWYQGEFYDIDGHLTRLKRSLKELRIKWDEEDSFPAISRELIKLNELQKEQALVYIQVSRGVAPRTHSFPANDVSPTIYAFASSTKADTIAIESGVSVLIKKEMRWSRCDIKSISLLPNTLCFQESKENGNYECVFVRDGLITEGTHSNIFFVINGALYTHPESEYILSGITRKNVIRIALDLGIPVKEKAVTETIIGNINEAFLAGTGVEITPVIMMGENIIGNGQPGPLTKSIMEKFKEETLALKG